MLSRILTSRLDFFLFRNPMWDEGHALFSNSRIYRSFVGLEKKKCIGLAGGVRCLMGPGLIGYLRSAVLSRVGPELWKHNIVEVRILLMSLGQRPLYSEGTLHQSRRSFPFHSFKMLGPIHPSIEYLYYEVKNLLPRRPDANKYQPL